MLLSSAHAQLRLTLMDVIELAHDQSISSKQAITVKKNAYWQYRNYKSNYNPQVVLSGSVPGYNRSVTQVVQPSGAIDYRSLKQLSSNLSLGLLQPIALTGGTISVNSSLNQFNNLLPQQAGTLNPIYSTNMVNIRLSQQIFGFNPLKWNKKTQPLVYEESKRSYVETMESISAEATNRFFRYLTAQVNLQIAQFNLANNDTIYNIEKGRYNIGKTTKDKLLQVELQLLQSQQDVAQARLDMQTSSLRLRTYIGLRGDSTIHDLNLELPAEIPEFEVTIDKALAYAKKNRAAYLDFELQKRQADREVERAKRSRVSTTLTATFGLNKQADNIPDTYVQPTGQQQINLGLNVPILNWGRTKSQVMTAKANQELTEYQIQQGVQNFEQEIITQVSQMEVLRLQVEITKKSAEVAQERYVVAQNRYLIGKVDITNLNIALTQKDTARRNYLGALNNFWTAFFNLRRLTLYDFMNDELLYQHED